jgi:hypothetical protein
MPRGGNVLQFQRPYRRSEIIRQAFQDACCGKRVDKTRFMNQGVFQESDWKIFQDKLHNDPGEIYDTANNDNRLCDDS